MSSARDEISKIQMAKSANKSAGLIVFERMRWKEKNGNFYALQLEHLLRSIEFIIQIRNISANDDIIYRACVCVRAHNLDSSSFFSVLFTIFHHPITWLFCSENSNKRHRNRAIQRKFSKTKPKQKEKSWINYMARMMRAIYNRPEHSIMETFKPKRAALNRNFVISFAAMDHSTIFICSVQWHSITGKCPKGDWAFGLLNDFSEPLWKKSEDRTNEIFYMSGKSRLFLLYLCITLYIIYDSNNYKS